MLIVFDIIFDVIVLGVAGVFAVRSGLQIRQIKDSAVVVIPARLKFVHGATLILTGVKIIGVLRHIFGSTDLSDLWKITKGGWSIVGFILNIIF